MSDLKAAGEFLESKGINLTNYAIFDTSGDFLQQIPIATWLNEFAGQQANKPTTSTEKSIVNEPVLAPRYFVVGYSGIQPMGVTIGTINIWGDTNYLSRAKATQIVEENNEGIKDVVITSVNELNEKDFEAWRGNGG